MRATVLNLFFAVGLASAVVAGTDSPAEFLVKATVGEKPVVLYEGRYFRECLNLEEWRRQEKCGISPLEFETFIRNYMEKQVQEGASAYGQVIDPGRAFGVIHGGADSRFCSLVQRGDSGIALTVGGTEIPVGVRKIEDSVPYVSVKDGRLFEMFRDNLRGSSGEYGKPYVQTVWLVTRSDLLAHWQVALDNNRAGDILRDMQVILASGRLSEPGGEQWKKFIKAYYSDHKGAFFKGCAIENRTSIPIEGVVKLGGNMYGIERGPLQKLQPGERRILSVEILPVDILCTNVSFYAEFWPSGGCRECGFASGGLNINRFVRQDSEVALVVKNGMPETTLCSIVIDVGELDAVPSFTFWINGVPVKAGQNLVLQRSYSFSVPAHAVDKIAVSCEGYKSVTKPIDKNALHMGVKGSLQVRLQKL